MRFLPALVLLLSACSGLGQTGQTYIDRYPVGERVDGDSRYVDSAIEAFDKDSPGHPLVATTEMFVPDFRAPDGTRLQTITSGGGNLIVVFRLADDSVRAYYVACGIGVQPDLCLTSPHDPG